jgi:hypothetical protein
MAADFQWALDLNLNVCELACLRIAIEDRIYLMRDRLECAHDQKARDHCRRFLSSTESLLAKVDHAIKRSWEANR